MSDNYVIEVRPKSAGVTVQAGIVVRDGEGFRFFAASHTFDALEGQVFKSPRAAERAARHRVDAKFRGPAQVVQFIVLAALFGAWLFIGGARAQSLPIVVPPGTALVVADQNEELQTLMAASGEQSRLAAKVSYANFLGGPSILEAFRAHALDLAQVGDAPPIQAQAAGEILPIVAARVSTQPDYKFAIRPRQAHFLWRRHRAPAVSAGRAQSRVPDAQ